MKHEKGMCQACGGFLAIVCFNCCEKEKDKAKLDGEAKGYHKIADIVRSKGMMTEEEALLELDKLLTKLKEVGDERLQNKRVL